MSRLDHRHNFSVYNTLLHLSSQQPSDTGFRIESLAFLPQISLSLVVLPLLLAKKDLASTMLAQTFAFVTFNKVCTSQVSLVDACNHRQLVNNCSTSFGTWSSCHSICPIQHSFSDQYWAPPLLHFGLWDKLCGCTKDLASSSSGNRHLCLDYGPQA